MSAQDNLGPQWGTYSPFKANYAGESSPYSFSSRDPQTGEASNIGDLSANLTGQRDAQRLFMPTAPGTTNMGPDGMGKPGMEVTGPHPDISMMRGSGYPFYYKDRPRIGADIWETHGFVPNKGLLGGSN